MNDHLMHLLVPAAFAVLIVWRMQARVRRLIGRQQLSQRRTWIRAALLPLVIAMFAWLAWQPHANPLLKVSLLGGVVLGVVLGLVGLRLTRFEVTAEGLFYTPSAHLGIALSALLVARLAWRFFSAGWPGWSQPAAAPPPGAQLTPLTVFLLATLIGYYGCYAIGLLRWAQRSRGAAESQAAS
jgi:membrane protein CcdC involved in cytochrome C biogenesis